MEASSNAVGNLAWNGLAKGVKYSRNALYTSVGSAAVFATGAYLTGGSSAASYSCTALSTVSVAVSGVAAKRLFDSVQMVKRCATAIAHNNYN